MRKKTGDMFNVSLVKHTKSQTGVGSGTWPSVGQAALAGSVPRAGALGAGRWAGPDLDSLCPHPIALSFLAESPGQALCQRHGS